MVTPRAFLSVLQKDFSIATTTPNHSVSEILGPLLEP